MKCIKRRKKISSSSLFSFLVSHLLCLTKLFKNSYLDLESRLPHFPYVSHPIPICLPFLTPTGWKLLFPKLPTFLFFIFYSQISLIPISWSSPFTEFLHFKMWFPPHICVRDFSFSNTHSLACFIYLHDECPHSVTYIFASLGILTQAFLFSILPFTYFPKKFLYFYNYSYCLFTVNCIFQSPIEIIL